MEKASVLDKVSPDLRKYIRKAKYGTKKAKVSKSSIIHENVDFICPICLDFICCSASFRCGHTYCESCLLDYELLFDQCLMCDDFIRNQEFRSCFVLDSLIEEFIQKSAPQDLSSYHRRQTETSQQRQKRAISDWQIGQKVDVRDARYVWSVGIISRLQPNKVNQLSTVTITYVGNQGVQEQIKQTSNRLAALGYYSSRSDIPHYEQVSQSSESNSSNQICIQLPSKSDSGKSTYTVSF